MFDRCVWTNFIMTDVGQIIFMMTDWTNFMMTDVDQIIFMMTDVWPRTCSSACQKAQCRSSG